MCCHWNSKQTKVFTLSLADGHDTCITQLLRIYRQAGICLHVRHPGRLNYFTALVHGFQATQRVLLSRFQTIHLYSSMLGLRLYNVVFPAVNNFLCPQPVDPTEYASAEELESVGPVRIKASLQALGLKCGGTLQERAQRLFSIRGKQPEEIDPSLFAKTTRQRKKPKK